MIVMVKKLAIAAVASLLGVPLTICAILYWSLGNCIYGPGVHDFAAQLTEGYRLHHLNGINITILGPLGLGVPPTVEELAYDRSFILAKQQQLRSRFENDDLGDPIPGKFNYWILDVNHSRCYGPLDETQFLAKRLELKVDPALILRDESCFDPRQNQGSMPPGTTPPAR